MRKSGKRPPENIGTGVKKGNARILSLQGGGMSIADISHDPTPMECPESKAFYYLRHFGWERMTPKEIHDTLVLVGRGDLAAGFSANE